MKLRHVAALALLGWYLMIPPQSLDGKRVLDDLPLSKWDSALGFDHAEVCASTSNRLQKEASHTGHLGAFTLEQLKYG